jgi:hypothetical protein
MQQRLHNGLSEWVAFGFGKQLVDALSHNYIQYDNSGFDLSFAKKMGDMDNRILVIID